MLYGAPLLPGAMTLLARIGEVQVIGVPAAALYFKTTSFDLLVPRLLPASPYPGKTSRGWEAAPSVSNLGTVCSLCVPSAGRNPGTPAALI